MRAVNSLIGTGVAGTASFNTNPVWATDLVRASFQILVSSGSCVGTFVIQGSNDQSTGVPANQFTPTNWVTIGSTASVVCSTTAASKAFLIPSTELSYEYIKIRFTDGSAASAIGVVQIRMKGMAL